MTPLAARLRAGSPQLGAIVKMPSPATVELLGHTGFDLAVLDTEHGAGGTDALEHHLRAADSVGLEAVVRVGGLDRAEILRALDAGASGVIVPHISTGAEARLAVAAAHYPPLGSRGLALSTRAGQQGTRPLAEHLRRAAADTVVIAQIEDATAVDNALEIAATPYLNAVWVGPGDLSLSLGHPGDLAHPDVDRAIGRVVEGVRRARNAALCVLVDDEHQARAWEARGASLLLFSAVALFAERLGRVAADARLAAFPASLDPDGAATPQEVPR